MADTRPFPWTDTYLLGYTPMDETHREFVQIVDAMLACPDAEFAAHMESFATHAERHFAEERPHAVTGKADCRVADPEEGRAQPRNCRK